MKKNKTMYFTGICHYTKCGATIMGHTDHETPLLCIKHGPKKEKK